MDDTYRPTQQIAIGEYAVLWYEKSNTYSIVDGPFKKLLDFYLEDHANFEKSVDHSYSEEQVTFLRETIHNYLKDCNLTKTPLNPPRIPLNNSKAAFTKYYRLREHLIAIHFDSELVLKTIHPAIAHLSIETTETAAIRFDIYLEDELLHLYKDKQLISAVRKQDYHFTQGKFIMHLLCSIHHKEEQDWIGTFHGSTITDGQSSILIVGNSGKGKSTLCALLAAQGFDILADDVSPMLSKDNHMYYNPSAISIKEGAFDRLRPLIPNMDTVPTVHFNKTKGAIKYIPYPRPKEDHYPCHTIVLVNYESNTETRLQSASIKTVLETLIPDSWISPNATHARQFLDWLQSVNLYSLTYSDTDSVTKTMSQLFKDARKQS